jgi:hypothetical protein
MEQQIKTQIMQFFKLSGYQIRSDVALLLAAKLKELPENERKTMIDKIFSNIQNQSMETSTIGESNMKAAIRVS